MNLLKLKSVSVSLLKTISFLLIACFACSCTEQAELKKVPIIYSSDLFHPHLDPDDHYDLATLYKMPEFDVKAFIFDMTMPPSRSHTEFGLAPLEQITTITNRPLPPYAMGLSQRLSSPEDQAKEQASEFQGGVDLILKTLRESNEKVVVFLVGSCRDFAVAYNREPELLRQKVSVIYVNAGIGPNSTQGESNVYADPNAYLCLMKSDLPVYWCPCFSRAVLVQASKEDIEEKNAYTYQTFFTTPNQAELLKDVSPRLKNFFNYALTVSKKEHLRYLDSVPEELPQTKRWMWCTGPFIHAAGRKIYAHPERGYIACSPQEARKLGISAKEVKVFSFDPVRITPKPSANPSELPVFQADLKVSKSTTKIFHYLHPEYNEILVSALSNILGN
jgi:hypothetical protein